MGKKPYIYECTGNPLQLLRTRGKATCADMEKYPKCIDEFFFKSAEHVYYDFIWFFFKKEEICIYKYNISGKVCEKLLAVRTYGNRRGTLGRLVRALFLSTLQPFVVF